MSWTTLLDKSFSGKKGRSLSLWIRDSNYQIEEEKKVNSGD